MGLSGIGFSELLMILVIIVLVFGTKKLGNLGSDLGSAIRGFRKAMNGENDTSSSTTTATPTPPPSADPNRTHSEGR